MWRLRFCISVLLFPDKMEISYNERFFDILFLLALLTLFVLILFNFIISILRLLAAAFGFNFRTYLFRFMPVNLPLDYQVDKYGGKVEPKYSC
jgi:hypothetical protein